jgi:hypothetical protein
MSEALPNSPRRHSHNPYLESLRGTECPHCANHKGAMKSFCMSCFMKLPTNMRGALYNRIGQGYEGAFDCAKAFLNTLPPKGGQRQ